MGCFSEIFAFQATVSCTLGINLHFRFLGSFWDGQNIYFVFLHKGGFFGLHLNIGGLLFIFGALEGTLVSFAVNCALGKLVYFKQLFCSLLFCLNVGQF